jgi:hypothetical protein
VNARVYLNSSTNSATSRIDGGGFSPPPIRAYSDVIVRFRLSREIEGESVPDDRPILGVSARIGYQDAEPTAGTVTLDLTLGGDTVTTAALAYNATAAQVETAINAALDASALDALHPCTVESLTEGYRIIFADPSQTVTVAADTNKLWPLSFVNADLVAFDGGWSTMLAYRQTAVAETASAEVTVPPIPTVTREQLGATTDGIAINEVQLIELSPSYAGGTFKLVWSGVKSGILQGFPTVEQLQTVLDALAPTGGIFNLIAIENGVLVEFAGSMAGEAQALMTTEEFTPPPVEYLVKLPTDTQAMRTMMAGAGTDGEIDLPMDIRVLVDDSDAPDEEQELNFPMELNFTRPVSDGNRNVSANLDYTQPLSRTNNAPFSPNALLVGNRARRFTIGDGVATSFVLPHNLGSLSGAFTAATSDICTKTAHNLHNGDPVTLSTTDTLPAGLSAGGTYYIVAATTDTFKLSLTPGGAAIDITSTGTGTHTVTVADGTTDVVFVEVWEAAGLKRRVSPEDYTVAITTADSITVSAFGSTPTSGQYQVIVQTAGRPATYQAHTHTIAEVTGLQAALDAIDARLLALESGDFPGNAPAPTSRLTGMITRHLPRVWKIPRARTLPADPGTLRDWNAFAEGSPLRDLRLLPAVHVASGSIEVLAPILPAADATYRDRVFYSAIERPDFPGGTLPAGAYAACDGRDWYRVRRETDAETTWYPTLFEVELFRLSISPDELALRTRLEMAFGFEAALLAPLRRPGERRAVGRYSLIIERGVRSSDASPATTGSNIDTHFTSPVILAQHDFDVTEVPVAKRFGISISRNGAGVIAAEVTNMMSPMTVSAPATADFVLRARLARPDFEDLPLDARGVLPIRGLDVGLDGKADSALGLYTIV